MRVHVAGRQMSVGETLRARIVAELDSHISKVFDRATNANVTVARANVGYVVDCVVNLPSGISLQAEGAGSDAHKAFAAALDRIRKRTQRYKQRLRSHHGHAENGRAPIQPSIGAASVSSSESSPDVRAEAADESPLVIAEFQPVLPDLSVSQAVAQLDETRAPAVMFRNAAHGEVNMVYRRADGNIGWVDPARPHVLNGHTKSA